MGYRCSASFGRLERCECVDPSDLVIHLHHLRSHVRRLELDEVVLRDILLQESSDTLHSRLGRECPRKHEKVAPDRLVRDEKRHDVVDRSRCELCGEPFDPSGRDFLDVLRGRQNIGHACPVLGENGDELGANGNGHRCGSSGGKRSISLSISHPEQGRAVRRPADHVKTS
jgi:hypothetical protein